MRTQRLSLSRNHPSARPTFRKTVCTNPFFSWSPDIDVWSGIADENKRTQLKTLLLNSFEAGVSAENRSFDKLQGIVTQLRTILQETSPLWLPTGQLEVDKDGEDFIVCVSPMVALLNHLSWLLETFQHVPDLVLIAR